LFAVPGLYTCEVDYEDLVRFDAQLADELRNNPTELMPIFESAAKAVISRSMVGQIDEAALHDIQIQLIRYNRFVSLRELRSDLVSRLVAVSGIIVSATRASTKAVGIALQCRNCKTTQRIPVCTLIVFVKVGWVIDSIVCVYSLRFVRVSVAPEFRAIASISRSTPTRSAARWIRSRFWPTRARSSTHSR
jgi:hypothetical protein